MVLHSAFLRDRASSIHRWCNNYTAVGRCYGYWARHRCKKSITSALQLFVAGMYNYTRGTLLSAIAIITPYWLDRCDSGGLPVSISITQQPTPQISLFTLPAQPFSTSGAIKLAVPAMVVVLMVMACISCAVPKSANFTTPPVSTNKLSHFKSR